MHVDGVEDDLDIHALSRFNCQVLSCFNPLTYLVDADRALFSDHLGDPTVWQGGLAAVLLVVIGLRVRRSDLLIPSQPSKRRGQTNS